MARPRKEGTHINVIIKQDLYEKFCAYAEEKGQTKTMALERLLEKALKEEKKDK
mgnify:FL=1